MSLEITLTVATTNITSPGLPSLGTFLVVILTHDATSNTRAITWSSDFRLASTAIDELTPNNISTFTFFGRVDPIDGITRWFLVGTPVIGAL